jgi:lipopolysaccharide exporter
MVAMRWSIRGIGLVSTILLARILLPQDFGLVAMASIMVGLLETLSAFGVDMALIQNVNATRRHFDTAWTVQVMQGVGVAVVLMFLAPLAALYFNEPRVAALIRFLAVGMAVGGFANIGVVAFRKELDFSLEFKFSVYKKAVSFVVTIGLAYFLHSYWALAIGMVLSQCLGVVLSYAMHPYRPRLSLQALRETWSFSQWMLIINIGNYAYEKGDEFVVGRLSPPRDMGIYTVAYEVSNLPTTELLYPISRALYPGYAKLAPEPERLLKAYLNVLSFIATFSVAAGFGIAAVASDLTKTVLGERWLDAVPLIQWLAFFGVLRAIYAQAGNVLLALGYARTLAVLTWLQILLLIPATTVAGMRFGVLGVAIAKLCVALVFAFLLFGALTRRTSVGISNLVLQIWRPCVSGVAMLFALRELRPFSMGIPLLDLTRDAIIGVIVYTITLAVLWLATGRPEGTEEQVFQQLHKWYRRRRV